MDISDYSPQTLELVRNLQDAGFARAEVAVIGVKVDRLIRAAAADARREQAEADAVLVEALRTEPLDRWQDYNAALVDAAHAIRHPWAVLAAQKGNDDGH